MTIRSADMTDPLRRLCAAVLEDTWALLEVQAAETVRWAEVEFTPGEWPKDAWPLRYLVLQIRKTQGELFATGSDTKYLALVTNRTGAGAALIERHWGWHWQKAGTIERVHDVTNNELGAAAPPCGRFGASAAWYRLSLFTYNVLSAMKALGLPASLTTARPKRLRFALFTLAGRLITGAGQLVLRISAEAERLGWLIAARTRLAVLQQRIASG